MKARRLRDAYRRACSEVFQPEYEAPIICRMRELLELQYVPYSAEPGSCYGSLFSGHGDVSLDTRRDSVPKSVSDVGFTNDVLDDECLRLGSNQEAIRRVQGWKQAHRELQAHKSVSKLEVPNGYADEVFAACRSRQYGVTHRRII